MPIASETELQALPVFDSEAFVEFEDLDDPQGGDLVENLVIDYRTNSVTLMENFKNGMMNDVKLAERSIHSLKSASDFLGGKRLALVCMAVENDVRTETKFDVPQVTSRIQAELSAFTSELNAFFDARAKRAS